MKITLDTDAVRDCIAEALSARGLCVQPEDVVLPDYVERSTWDDKPAVCAVVELGPPGGAR